MPTLAETRAIEYPEIVDLGPFEEPEETPDDGREADTDDGADTGEPASGPVGADGTLSPSADEPAAEPAAEVTADVTDEKPADGVDKSAAYDQLNELYTNDRAGFVKQLLAGLSDEERAAIVGETGRDAHSTEAAAPEWEPESDGERWLQQHAKAISELPAFAQGVQQEFTVRDRYINEALVSNAALQEQVRALSEIIGVTLPELDVAAVQATLKQGKVGYRDAIRQHYGEALKNTVKTKQQAAKPRPRTPGDAGNDIPQVKPGMSMTEIFNLQK